MLIRRPWSTQPREAGRLDLGNPLTRGLVFVKAELGDGYTIKEGAEVVFAATGAPKPSALGDLLGLSFTASSSQAIDCGSQPAGLTAVTTLSISASQSSTSGFAASTAATFSAPGIDWALWAENSTAGRVQPLRLAVSTTRHVSGTATGLNDNRPHVLVGRWASGEDVYGWADGVSVGTSGIGAISGTVGSGQNLFIAKRGTLYFTGSVFLTMLWDRKLPDDEISEISRNPWQVFRPRHIWVPQAAITGLPTLSLSTYKPGTLTSSGWTPRITAS